MPNLPSVLGVLAGPQRVQLIQGPSVVSIDASMSENHSRKAVPTEFELETGETISDHIILKPFMLELNGIISDTPIDILQAALITGATAILPPAGIVGAGVLGVAVSSALSGSKKPSVQNFLALMNLQEQRLPITVVTTLQVYNNMFITDVSVPRDSQNGNVLNFKVSLVQLLIVSPQTVNVNIYADPNLSAGDSNVGQQNSIFVTQFEKSRAYIKKIPAQLGIQ